MEDKLDAFSSHNPTMLHFQKALVTAMGIFGCTPAASKGMSRRQSNCKEGIK